MKILFGITKSNFGGAQRYVFDLAVEAQKSGHEVAVLCGGEGELVRKLKVESIKTIIIPELGRDISILKDWKTFKFILKTLREEKPDVFHTNSSKMGGLGNLAARMAGIKKIIFTAHGWAFNENRNWLSKIIISKLVWYSILLSHKTICVSEKTEADVACWPFVYNKLVVIYNGLKPFEAKPVENHEFTVGALSELHWIKGLDILLKAWKIFTRDRHARLVIFGEGEERNNLENLIKELSVSNSVELKGFVPNARAELSNFNIFVLPSRSEAMPYALFEAGSIGIPSIASSVGGIPEIIQNEQNGLLVEKENVEQLASALTRLFDNPSFREKIGANLKETISTKFSFDKMVQETFAIYKHLHV